MQDQQTVQVHGFRHLGEHTKTLEVATFKATIEKIQSLGGQPLLGTGQLVLVSELDAEGRYRRIATGWGAL